MSRPSLIPALEAALEALLDATGASRATFRADDPALGWRSATPCAEVLRHGAPSMLADGSLNHRAAATIRWIDETRAILIQDDLRGVQPPPPAALTEIYKAKAQMVGPVFVDDALYGWVSAHDVTGPRPWSQADKTAMDTAIATIWRLVTTRA